MGGNYQSRSSNPCLSSERDSPVRLLIGFTLAALAVCGFASTFVFGSSLTRTCGVSPTVLAFLRFVIALAVLLPVSLSTARWRRSLFSPVRADWLRMTWLGPVGTSLMAWFVFMGCARVSAANASMADALAPLMIFAVAAIRSKHMSVGETFGLSCGFVGALLVIQVVGIGGLALEAYSIGDIYILLSAVAWGVYTGFGRELVVRMGATAFSVWTMLFGAVAIGLFLPFGDFAWPADARTWQLVAAQGVFSTLLPFVTWNAAQKYLPVTILAMSAYFTPVVTVALAIVFLNEGATGMQWIGTLFIIASAVVETRRSRNCTSSK